MHIARIDFPSFYSCAFNGMAGVRELIECIRKTSARDNDAKIVLHQSDRMIWLADRMDECAKGRPALQILFYIIAAEAVGKLVDGFEGEGRSKYYVRYFFEKICSEDHHKILEQAFSDDCLHIKLRAAVDFLYSIRCDVAHRGQYFSYSLRNNPHDTPMLTPSGTGHYIAYITSDELRQVVIEGTILGALQFLPENSSCRDIIKL